MFRRGDWVLSKMTDLSHEEGSFQIYIDHKIKILFVHVEEVVVLGNTGRVDNDIRRSLVGLQNVLKTFSNGG